MASLWPIIVLADAADALRVGPFHLHQHTPSGFALSNFVSQGCCQCPGMGPLHFWQLPPTASVWPIIFSPNADDSLRRACFISCSCYQWLRFSPLIFWRL